MRLQFKEENMVEVSAAPQFFQSNINRQEVTEFNPIINPIDWNEYRKLNGIDLESIQRVYNRRALLEETEQKAKREAEALLPPEQKELLKKHKISNLKKEIAKMEGE